jgi:hypothetical protein
MRIQPGLWQIRTSCWMADGLSGVGVSGVSPAPGASHVARAFQPEICLCGKLVCPVASHVARHVARAFQPELCPPGELVCPHGWRRQVSREAAKPRRFSRSWGRC